MKIKLDKVSDYKIHWSFSKREILNLLLNNTQALYPKKLLFVMTILLVVLSLFKVDALAILIPVLMAYFHVYLSSRKIERSMKIKRSFSKKSKENKNELVSYDFIGDFRINLSNLVLIDFFTGETSKRGEISKRILYLNQNDLKSLKSIKESFHLNNGMGRHSFGPFNFIGTDLLGFNLIKCSNSRTEEIIVYPHVYNLAVPKTKSDDYSSHFGLFDAKSRGDSINFFSTREYREGDPIKHINWKLSLKTNIPIVNEFENNTNSKIDILLLNDERVHVGFGHLSTFEASKDLTLSILKKHIHSNNSISLKTFDKNFKAKTGLRHLKAIERFVTDLNPLEFSRESLYSKKVNPLEVAKLFKEMRKNITDQSHLFLISGLVPGRLIDIYLDELIKISKHVKVTHLVLTYVGLDFLKKVPEGDKVWVSKVLEQYPETIEKIKIKARRSNLKLSFVELNSKTQYKYILKDTFAKRK